MSVTEPNLGPAPGRACAAPRALRRARGAGGWGAGRSGGLVAAYGIQFHDQGWNLGPLHWEPGVLPPGPPGKAPSGTYAIVSAAAWHPSGTGGFFSVPSF